MPTRRGLIGAGLTAALLLNHRKLFAATEPPPTNIAPQPYFAQLGRVVDVLRDLGDPIDPDDVALLENLARTPSSTDITRAEKALERYVLLRCHIDQQGKAVTTPGAATTKLVEQGWRSFLVRVDNPFAFQGEVDLISDTGEPEGDLILPSQRNNNSIEPALPWGYSVDHPMQQPDYAARWMGYKFYSGQLMPPRLSGLGIEYRVLQLYSRDRGRKSAYLQILSAPSQRPLWSWLGARRGFEATFDCLPSKDVELEILDGDGRGCMASLVIKDQAGRIYPAPGHRLAPDFDFQPQVYRADGETVRLPVGSYRIDTWRGPEYLRQSHAFTVDESDTSPRFKVRMERWINAASLGWYPGDTHIHPSGCMHYAVPTRGVSPETMIRHVRGEALAVGDVLIWGPGYYHQKQFFSGHVFEPKDILEVPEFQQANNTSLKPVPAPHDKESLIRYDMEISGFPSAHSGHLVLLGLRDQNYPGAATVEQWPSWCLPILQWAKAQGAVTGYAHCGAGLSTLDVESVGVSERFIEGPDLPNYVIPLFNAVGANEFLVDVTHGVVDFVSGTQMPPVVELNFWYHTLNCGFRTAMVGETDFPCASDARVGAGRTYVGLDKTPSGEAAFNAWVDGIRRGRLYFGDGCSHFVDFQINGHDVGDADVELAEPGQVIVKAKVAARLEPERVSHLPDIPAWNIEHARLGDSRQVNLEVVVNGMPVLTRAIQADGSLIQFSAPIRIDQSSWVALRILRTGHTAPLYVQVAGRPIRASRRSARWCLDCLDVLWKEKGPRIRESERKAAQAAYHHAKTVYQKIMSECKQD